MKMINLLIACFMASAVSALSQPTDGNTVEPSSRTGRSTGWSQDFTIAGFTGQDGFAPHVFDFARAPDGGVLATGYFQWVGDRRVDPVMQLAEGTWQPVREDWGREVPLGGFTAVAATDAGELALSTFGGRFGGAVEIWLATATGIEVIGDLSGAVRSMEWFEGELWVGGYFIMEETGLTHLAVWDGATWSSPPGGPADGAVYRLSVSQGTLLMAGEFTSVGGTDARRVAEWDGTDWRAYDMDVGRVYAVTRSDSGELFAGGRVSGGLVQWTGAQWEVVGGGVFFEVWEGAVSGVVSDVVMHQGDLYVTGCFSHVNEAPPEPGSIRAESVARWTGSQWESLDDGSQSVGSVWVHPNACGFEPGPFAIWEVQHQRLFSDGEQVFLGGWFPGVSGVPSQSIVSFDGHEWGAVGRTEDGLFGAPEAVAVGGPKHSVHVLGSISHAGTTPATSGIFRYDRGRRGGRWTAVGDPLPSDVIFCDKLAVDRRGRVFVGCGELLAPWIQVVLRLDGHSWVRLGPLPGIGSVEDMRFDARGRLWVAGGISGGLPGEEVPDSGYVARWDGDAFTIVEDGFDSIVRRIAFPPTGSPRSRALDVIAAGTFTHIGSGTYARIARLRDGQWQELGSGLSTGVMALAWGRDAIYASTEPTDDPGIERLLLARWDGAEWHDVATPENGMPPPMEDNVHWIYDLLAYRGHVIVAGSLWPESGGARHAFVYDERRGRVTPLGGGLNAIYVSAVALSRHELWFAGPIAEAGFGETRIPSVGVARIRFRHHPAVPTANGPDAVDLPAPAYSGIDD